MPIDVVNCNGASEAPGRSFDPIARLEFHFAGHGATHSTDPSQSYLLPQDGKSGPLSVASLLDINLYKHSPFLAFLSACGTGKIRDERLFDESKHLISAFQLVGFRYVVGTLWEATDDMCVEITRMTYEDISDEVLTDVSVCLVGGRQVSAQMSSMRNISLSDAKAEKASERNCKGNETYLILMTPRSHCAGSPTFTLEFEQAVRNSPEST